MPVREFRFKDSNIRKNDDLCSFKNPKIMDYRFTIALIYYFDGTVGARGPNGEADRGVDTVDSPFAK